jgi:RNA polymerase sigma factor (sigma-70 family)
MSSEKETYQVLKLDREKGIKLLFELYAKKLLGYATFNWKVEHDAIWDLVYKTIYKVADVIHEYEFENEQKFASFIFKIFINYLRNYVRDSKTAAQGITEIPLNDYIIGNYAAHSKNTQPTQSLKILQQELDKLEDWERILLLMRSQNVPYGEISKFVDKREGLLKVYYARLKKQLSENISKQLSKTNAKENA